MSVSGESPAVNQARLDPGKARKERRRSSLSRGRRSRQSSIGIPGLRNDDTNIKSFKEPADLEKLLTNCFETALKHSTEYLNSEGDKNQITSEVRQFFKEVLADVMSENECPKTNTSEECSSLRQIDLKMEQDIERCEIYNKKLEKQCKDWDGITAKLANEEFLRSDISSELAFDNTKPQSMPNCKQLLQNLNHMKEKLLIKVDRFSTEVDFQAKITFGIQDATKPSKLYRNNFSADKISSPNFKQLILELPLDVSYLAS